MATNYYNSFIQKLEEIFMMNHAELDFGIYRIMNQKRADIKQFLERDLLTQVKQILKENSGGLTDAEKSRKEDIERMYGEAINTLPDTVPDVQEYKKLQTKAAKGGDLAVLENDVFTHLTTFFGRYYDEGDFLSKRRYKDGAYAIPYNGEEVKLHWANADQYYIKTSEYFRNYTFVLPESRRKVHFVLRDATTEQNNNKAAANMERRFALWLPSNFGEIDSLFDSGPNTVERIDDELYIYFTYDLMPKSTNQKDLCADAMSILKMLIHGDFEELLKPGKAPTKDNPKRTLLEKHLTDYTAKNSFDYFIHKDLGGFLRRELDFYIKNEVMHIDDLDMNHIQQELSKAKAIKGVGDKIIRMLASLEDFQKKLWLKKKFVVQCDYCITLDRVPETFYPEICANEAQRKEWVRLFAIDEIKSDLTNVGYSEPLTIDFLKQNPFLVLDTAFFSDAFKHKLLASVDNVDEQTNGLLINSENFQASKLIMNSYSSKVKCVYLDPPYNTSEVGFVYKNNYRHSSWASMICDRIKNAYQMLTDDGALMITIDDEELYDLKQIIDDTLGKDKFIGNIVIESNPRGRGINSFYATCHEYCLVYAKQPNDVYIIDNDLTEEQAKGYSGSDDQGIAYRALPFRRSGGWSTPEDRPNSEFSLYFNESGKLFAVGGERKYDVPREYVASKILTLNDNNDLIEMTESDFNNRFPNAIKVMPIDTKGMRRVWRWSDRKKILLCGAKGEFIINKEKDYYYVQLKDWIKNGRKAKTIWCNPKYDSSSHGTNLLKDILGERNAFGFPKSVYSTYDSIHTIIGDENGGAVLDLFAGSGTTAHAIIKMYRDDEVPRNYILCEMGEYFDKVTKRRIEKIIYTDTWRNGKPVSRDGISQCFKYIRLEQYEDTLNNLVIEQAQELFPEASDKNFKESYMLGYMMDTETRGSLFNLQWFVNPFAMTLKTTRDNELVETKVDMVETFNFLIGLNVETIHWHKDDAICVVEGKTHRRGEKTLVIWRDCTRIDNDQLNSFFERMDYSTQTRDFDVIYVNGDNKLPNLRRDDDHWKVVLIEDEFKKRMVEEA